MAKRIVDEEMRFTIVVNGDKAQKELYDLEKSTRDLTSRNKELRAEQAKLVASGQKNSAAYKALSAEIKQNNTVIKANKAQMKALQEQIGVTGLTMAQLKKKAAELRLQLYNMVPGSAQFKKFNAELGAVNTRLSELRNQGRASELSLGSLANGFNKYAALGASAIATITGIVFSVQKLIDFNGKLSDAQSDVQKTTGLTKEEVDELTKSFGALDSRTSRINKLKIAEEGGRIGIAKEEIEDFVNIMDKAVVALGDSFPGGVEETASKLGKLKLLFKETKEQSVDEAYNTIGSAINELGANGVATEINIANFATRVGSLPDVLKPSIADTLALGAGFEESGIQAEIAGRAYSILLNQASTETEKFGEVMGITADEVARLINDDPLEFMIQFAEGLNGMNATDTADTLAYLGVQADGANKVLGALSNNTQRFRDLLVLSNDSMREGTSLVNEYNIKNTNFAATLDKLQKYFMGIFVSGPIVNGVKGLIMSLADLLGIADDLSEAFDKESKQLFENTKANRALAESSADLLDEYEALMDEGVDPTTEAKKRLDEITLILSDNLGDSVIAIDKETGALLLNTQAVREQIKLKRFAADEDAATIASRLKGAQDEIKLLEQRQKALQPTLEGRTRLARKALAPFGTTVAQDDFQRGLPEVQELNKVSKAYMQLSDDIEVQKERVAEFLVQLKELNFSEADVDNLFKTNTGNDAPAGPLQGTFNAGGLDNGDLFKTPTGGTPAQKEARKSLLDFQRETEDARLELISDSYRKELEMQRVAHERKIADLQSQKQTGTAGATEVNAEINRQIAVQNEINNLRVGTIVENGIQDRIEKLGDGYEREKQLRLVQHNQQLAALGDNEKKKLELQEDFNKRELVEEEKQLQELLRIVDEIKDSGYFGGVNLDLLTTEQLQVFESLADDLILKLSEIGVAKAALSKGGGSESDLDAGNSLAQSFESTDIFGFTPQQWAETFDSLDTVNEKMQAAVVVATAMSNAYGQYNDFVNNKTQIELANFEKAQQKKKDALERNLESGYVNQRQYNESVRAIEQETEARRAEAEYEQAKRNKVQALANIAINTAAAIMGIWAQVPKFDFGVSAGLMTAFVGGLGLLQAGLVAATPLPAKGYEMGYYGNMPVQREQDGKVFNASYGGTPSTQLVDQPKYFLAGEGGKDFPEMIIDGRAFKNFNPDFKNSLYREIARVKGYEGGYYQKEGSQASSSGSNDVMLMATLARTNEVLDRIQSEGIEAFLVRSFRTAKDLQEDIEDYNKLRNKNKK